MKRNTPWNNVMFDVGWRGFTYAINHRVTKSFGLDDSMPESTLLDSKQPFAHMNICLAMPNEM